MRINDEFAKERKSGIKNYNPKFFIISEGHRTEPKYFDGLNKSVISQSATIINILRDYEKEGESHPLKIVELLKDFANNSGEFITVKELKNKVKNWNHINNNKIDYNNMEIELNNMFHNDNYKISNDKIEELFLELFKSELYKEIAENFRDYIFLQEFTYNEKLDSINLVIDRDKDNFFDNQYDEVKEFCKNNKVNLYVSNPNFEFWLYLHFAEIENEDKAKLFENKKVNKSRRYIEKRLHDICGYTKTKFRFEEFENHVEEAILREKNYEEDIEQLKNNLGTNVGILVKKITE